MAEMKINVGQIWKRDETGESFLVTRIYTEALATIVVLRSTSDDKAKPLRIKVSHTKGSTTLPGFSPAQSFEVS